MAGLRRVSDSHDAWSDDHESLLSSSDTFSDSDDARSDDHESLLSSFYTCVSKFSDSHHAWLSKQEFKEEIDKISEWVEEQKKQSKNQSKVIKRVETVCNFACSATNAILKMTSGQASDIVSGSMDIVSSLVTCVGAFAGPIGAVVGGIIGTICNIIGAIFTASKPEKHSVVEQLAKVVHQELVNFNKTLQDQKYHGLVDRVTEQKTQLRTMERGDDLVDPNLWHDYVQFLGELSSRFESPLPFTYENNLTKDPDVADFVTAVTTYCQAYNCFMALLLSAKGRFSHLEETESRMRKVDLVISCQRVAGKRKLAFLSEEKYLTFLGRLPYEGGKLTKIVALSRNSEARSKLESVRRGFGLPKFPDFETVESKAKHVSGLSVKVPGPSEGDFISRYTIQFINHTKFPMKVVCASAGNCDNNLEFIEEVEPYSSFRTVTTCYYTITVSGYILLYLDGKVPSDSSDVHPRSADETRVMEFALSWPYQDYPKINIQDKTAREFTKGEDTFDKMQDREKKTIYWLTDDTHYMACGEVLCHPLFPAFIMWRFIIKDYDPFQDCVSMP